MLVHGDGACWQALTPMERMCGWFADLGTAIPELRQCRDMAVWARLLMEPSQVPQPRRVATPLHPPIPAPPCPDGALMEP